MASLTFLFFLAGPEPPLLQYSTLLGFFLLIAKEIVVGIALAFVTNIFFTLTFTAGQLIDMQIGFGIVNVYDPQNNTQIPMIGNVLNIVLLITFFLVDGHQRLIYILFLTMEALPIGSLALSGNIGLVMLEIFANAFAIGIMVALPVLAAGLVIEITFGTLARSVPQLHMFVIGMPLKTMIGFLLLSILLPVFIGFSGRIFSEMFKALDLVFGTLRGL
jgi:flagellar biosynthetic protein FliR